MVVSNDSALGSEGPICDVMVCTRYAARFRVELLGERLVAHDLAPGVRRLGLEKTLG
jgi:hypothetical protein